MDTRKFWNDTLKLIKNILKVHYFTTTIIPMIMLLWHVMVCLFFISMHSANDCNIHNVSVNILPN